MSSSTDEHLIFKTEQFLRLGCPTKEQIPLKKEFFPLRPPSADVMRCVRNFHGTGNISPLKPYGRPRTVRTTRNINVVREMFEDNLKVSINNLVEQLDLPLK